MLKKILEHNRPIIISGPCSAETEEQTLETCRQLAVTGRVNILRAGIWKPRTKPGNFEGAGEEGLKWMAAAKKETGLPIATEVANAKHVELALKYGVDLFWVGARTTVNPFSVQEIAEALQGVDIPVLVKNPLNPEVALWAGAIERLSKVGISSLGLIHRGFSSFAPSVYRNNPMWHLALEMRRLMPEIPIIGDPSHIAGKREYLFELSQQAADLNYDGLIVESHNCPDCAWSDASQQLTPADLDKMLGKLVWRHETIEKADYLQQIDTLRSQIDQYDSELFELLSRRMAVASKIGEVKRDNSVMIFQSKRWDEIVGRFTAQAEKLDLSKEFISIVLNSIHMESISRQNSIMNK